MSVAGAFSYIVLLGAAFGAAMVLYFGLRAIKLI
ncbi:MAG: cytochrome b6-f complex subunit 6 [Leptolyngbyaceae cyanobacterium T60_A2020_046]|nr:cytochrome b6-f complex subunit 6 [Leptolyngbyaceae cyanobacterium T60_A2020_046]